MKHLNKRLQGKRHHGCRSCAGGCLLILLILAAIIACSFFLFKQADTTQAQTEKKPLAVWLLIDNSNSMFEKDGVGSDPKLLRLDAARLFLSYLGVDEPEQIHQAAVIFFGSQAETAVPLTPLTHDELRRQLFTQIAHPERLGWTDHLAALDLAYSQIETQGNPAQSAIILLTDGEPEWDTAPTAAEKDAYLAQLEAKGADLAEVGVSLFIILLTNDSLINQEDNINIWQPLWQRLAAATPTGQFLVAHSATELPDIYHQIVIALTERETEGMVVQTAVTEPMTKTLTIAPNLSQLTLVIRKETLTQTVSILTGNGQPLTPNQVQIRHAGGQGEAREEIWVIEEPQPGQWQLQLSGQGEIAIWQDIVSKPEPTPTSTTTAMPTPLPSQTALFPATATATVTATAVPTMASSATVTPSILFQTRPEMTVIPQSSTGNRPLAIETSLPWPWFFGGLILLLCGSAVFYWRHHQNRPWVVGTLHILDGQLPGSRGNPIDLDDLHRQVVTIGQAPADVPLRGATAQAAIRPQIAPDDICDYLISPLNGLVRLNGITLTHETRLTDTAVLDIGGVRLRYENLQLRQAEKERQVYLEMSSTL